MRKHQWWKCSTLWVFAAACSDLPETYLSTKEPLDITLPLYHGSKQNPDVSRKAFTYSFSRYYCFDESGGHFKNITQKKEFFWDQKNSRVSKSHWPVVLFYLRPLARLVFVSHWHIIHNYRYTMSNEGIFMTLEASPTGIGSFYFNSAKISVQVWWGSWMNMPPLIEHYSWCAQQPMDAAFSGIFGPNETAVTAKLKVTTLLPQYSHRSIGLAIYSGWVEDRIQALLRESGKNCSLLTFDQINERWT